MHCIILLYYVTDLNGFTNYILFFKIKHYIIKIELKRKPNQSTTFWYNTFSIANSLVTFTKRKKKSSILKRITGN